MAVDMFMKIEGIDGESLDSAHKDWIELLSWSFGASQPASVFGDPGQQSIPEDFRIVKRLDKASPLLFTRCCSGEHIQTASLALRKTGGKPLDYVFIKMTDCLISSVRPGAGPQPASSPLAGSPSESIPLEEVSFSFLKVEYDFTPTDKSGRPPATGPVHGGWDFETHTAA